MQVFSLRERPDLAERAAVYFPDKWGNPVVYRDAIAHAVSPGMALPMWYLLLDGDEIVGCAGMISNDFVSRGDLYPWLCALYIEESFRGRALGKLLIDRIKEDAARLGYPHVYLATDHIGYYEKYGFSHIGTGYHPWDESSRIYRADTPLPKKGRILFLNGVTSSGKTSIVDALQAREDVFFYALANDLFQETVGERYLEQDYWKYLSRAIHLMYHTAKLLSDRGENVILDGILVERPELSPHCETVLSLFRDNPLSIVEVACPLEVCRARNLARGDRGEFQSEEQSRLMAKGIPYAMRVETDKMTPEACADEILRRLFPRQ